VQWLLALALYEAGHLTQCRKLTTDLALTEPTNRSAEGMLGVLKERYQADGPVGLQWVAAGALAAVALVGVLVWLWARRGRAAGAATAAVATSAATVTAPFSGGRGAMSAPAAAGSRHLRFSSPSSASR